MHNITKLTNIHVIGLPEKRKERERNKQMKLQKLIQRNHENFSYLIKNINLHIQEAQQTTSRKNTKRATQQHDS